MIPSPRLEVQRRRRAKDPQSASRAVREMFTSIAPRYDLLNHVLSFNIDRLWWRRAARTFGHVLQHPQARVLDLCCGTGDMAFALRRRAGKTAKILGADFSHAMLQRAHRKSAGTRLRWLEADALQLPFPEASFNPGHSRLSAFATWRITTPVLPKLFACSLPAANAAFWILPNPEDLWAGSTGSTSNMCCPR